MSQEEREKVLEILHETFERPGGKQAFRFILNVLSATPVVGGAIAGSGALWAEREQSATNASLLEWAKLTNSEIENIHKQLSSLLRSPSQASLSLLLGEIFGDEIATELLQRQPSSIAVVLNSATISELEPYIENKWVSLQSTGSICSMGAGNRVGNHFEELKRPYGLGNGFVLNVNLQSGPQT